MKGIRKFRPFFILGIATIFVILLLQTNLDYKKPFNLLKQRYYYVSQIYFVHHVSIDFFVTEICIIFWLTFLLLKCLSYFDWLFCYWNVYHILTDFFVTEMSIIFWLTFCYWILYHIFDAFRNGEALAENFTERFYNFFDPPNTNHQISKQSYWEQKWKDFQAG